MSKRSLDTVAQGPGNSGVAIGTINRVFDENSLKQLRLETSGAAYTGMMADVRTQLDKLYGTPGTTSALDGVMNSFTLSLQTLGAAPDSAPARSAVVAAASNLATKIGSIAEGVQSLRTATESQLSNDTSAASSLLSSIAQLNVKIAATSDDGSKVALLDQRDQALNSLSGYLDVQASVQRDGTVTVMTNSGMTLVDRASAATLSFDGRGTLGPEDSYSADPAQRGVGNHHGDHAGRRNDRSGGLERDPFRLAGCWNRTARYGSAPGPAPARRSRGGPVAVAVR